MPNYRIDHQYRKVLQDWAMYFNESDAFRAEQFLEDVRELRDAGKYSDRPIIRTLVTVLDDGGKQWFRTLKDSLNR